MRRAVGTRIVASPRPSLNFSLRLAGTKNRFWHNEGSSEKSGRYSYESDSNQKVENMDHYSSSTYTDGKTNTRVVCRQKPIMKSRGEKFWEYMKPTMAPGHEMLDTVQLSKILGYLALPVFILMWWKGAYAAYPDEWEAKYQGFQNRPNREIENSAKGESYFDVIDRLENRREAALARKGYDTASSVPAPKQ